MANRIISTVSLEMPTAAKVKIMVFCNGETYCLYFVPWRWRQDVPLKRR